MTRWMQKQSDLNRKSSPLELKPIKNEVEYDELLNWIDVQFDAAPAPDSPEGNKLQIALLLVKAYEDEHYQIPSPDPIDAIKIKMDEKGLKSKDLVEWVGSKSYISALLNRKKPLILKLAKLSMKNLASLLRFRLTETPAPDINRPANIPPSATPSI